MAVTLGTARIALNFNSELLSGLDFSTVKDPVSQAYSWVFGNGVGANQANQVWHDQRTLAASATEDLDFAGVLTNAFGATVTFAKIRAILIVAASGNTNNVNVTRPASNGLPLFLAASDGLAIAPGGAFMFIAPNLAGLAVTAGTGDLLTITNSAGSTSVTYDVFVIGNE